jgi:hypothetical protein
MAMVSEPSAVLSQGLSQVIPQFAYIPTGIAKNELCLSIFLFLLLLLLLLFY